MHGAMEPGSWMLSEPCRSSKEFLFCHPIRNHVCAVLWIPTGARRHHDLSGLGGTKRIER